MSHVFGILNSCALISRRRFASAWRRTTQALWLAPLCAGVMQAHAQTALADGPIFAAAAARVPSNVALALSVEWPTAVRSAHTTAYVTTDTYLGYFDPDKCYGYQYYAVETPTQLRHFFPAGANTAHNCTTAGQWSGNYLNWASTPTIDPFRWALTGGYRIIDTPTTTILQKARDTGQGLAPDKQINSAATVDAASPLTGFTALHTRIQNQELDMLFADTAAALGGAIADYDPAAPAVAGTVYRVSMRVKVCDASTGTGGVEANCRPYGSNWKPEGLMHAYANRISFSAFGYLNDSSGNRDGGVLRAQQKFVGPTRPVPGQPDASNMLDAIDNTQTPAQAIRRSAEWDPETGVFFRNPDPDDVAATNAAFGPSVPVADSGVMNYLNKFGQLNTNNYKSFDPVSELYYTALRYYKHQPNVPSYTAITGGANTATQQLDNFPSITDWNDPIRYSCQRNFILGIGDIYTWNDKNIPGNTGRSSEPALPALVAGDATMTFGSDTAAAANATTWTNAAFGLQALGVPDWNNYSGRNNSAGIVGMAYYANTSDIRPTETGNELATRGRQTVQTMWVDVLEQPFQADNQFYLAAKYGGFNVPGTSRNEGFDAATRAAALPQGWWSTNGQMLAATQPRPDNYFAAGRPDTMVAGLTEAFSRINTLSSSTTTSFALPQPQVAAGGGNLSITSQYNPEYWTSVVTGNSLSFDAATGTPTPTQTWNSTNVLAAQFAGSGWLDGRRVVTYNGTQGVRFQANAITAAQLAALNTTYRTTTGTGTDDAADYLNYLRGDRSLEGPVANANGTTTPRYRIRQELLGDIVGSRVLVAQAPDMPLSDAYNPGYSQFKIDHATRPRVAYAGSNDGMLHAFDGATGRELFAYVPAATFNGPTAATVDGLATLGNPNFVHHNFVNATPALQDIDVGRTYTAGSIGTTTDWRSILIGGLGKGGRSYYAIDVTDPPTATSTEASVAARVLWEISPPGMGYTFGEAFAVKTRKYGWTIVLPSGYNTPAATVNGVARPAGTAYIYLVHPLSGAVLETIVMPTVPGEASTAPSAAYDLGLAHANAYVLDSTDGYADAIYAGDLRGNLWRVDMTGGTVATPMPALLMARLTDQATSTGQPVTTRPRIALHPRTRDRVVMVGTGRLLDATDIASTQEQTFYAIRDGNRIRFNRARSALSGAPADPPELPTGISFPLRRSELLAVSQAQLTTNGVTLPADHPMGWYHDLGNGPRPASVAYRVILDSDVFLGTVAFAATLPSITDPCQPSGSSRVYATDFASGASRVVVDGVTMPYFSIDGSVTDLQFVSVGGTARLLVGTDQGSVRPVPGDFGFGIGIKRLNWREIPVTN